jgi:hypothetical protein
MRRDSLADGGEVVVVFTGWTEEASYMSFR